MNFRKPFQPLMLALILMLSFPVTFAHAETAVDWKELYKSYLSEHIFTLDRNLQFNEEYLSLVDLDRDGIPELIHGSTYRTVNSVNEIVTIRNGQAVKLKDQYPLKEYYEGNYVVGMQAFLTDDSYRGIKLYYHPQTGAYKYISEDGGSSVDGAYITTYEISISGATLITSLISSAFLLNPDKLGLEGFEERFRVGGNNTSKAQYESYMANYYKGWTEVPHGGHTEQVMSIFDMWDGSVDNAALQQFLNSYATSEAIRVNQRPAEWAQAEIDEALQLRLVPDEINRAFHNSINRQEFSQLIMQFLSVKLNAASEELPARFGKSVNPDSFTDTTNQDVLAAQALGIVTGKGDNTFDPDGYITRQEAAVMLSRTAELLSLNTAAANPGFKDSHLIAGWATAGVDFVASAKEGTNGASIMGGTGNGQFSPIALYSRQQAIITVKRLYNAR